MSVDFGCVELLRWRIWNGGMFIDHGQCSLHTNYYIYIYIYIEREIMFVYHL